MRSSTLLLYCIIAAGAAMLGSCTSSQTATAPFIEYGTFPRPIPIAPPSPQQRERFNALVPGIRDSVVKNDTLIRGYRTRNREFLSDVITPMVLPVLDSLRAKKPVEIINALAIFGHEVVRMYLGNEFYRWGGDINDLDDPQESRTRFAYAYGLDCSGYACLPYELAVHFGLMDSTSAGALFSSKGFGRYCRANNVPDRGGRVNGINRYRPDTDDLHRIGREIFSVERGGVPTAEQMRMTQPGDIVVRNGHVGLLVMINQEMYYLESGGRVVPRVGWHPCHAREAIEIFAKSGPLSIRRALPDLHPVMTADAGGVMAMAPDAAPGGALAAARSADTSKYTIENCVNVFTPAKVESTKAGYQYWFVDKTFIDGRTLKMSVVAPHQATHAPHRHAEDEFFFVLEGTAEFSLNGKTKTAGPYASFYCPTGSLHGIRNAGDTVLKYLVIKKYEK